MEQIPICVAIIAKNEERNLAACLDSVRWAKEIVMIDDLSEDRTVDIAKRYTDKILTRHMDIEGKHRNFAYAQATQEWILSLDADERVSAELALELKKTVEQNDASISGYSIPVKTFIGKRWIQWAGYYPARKLRMHRKGKFRYEETGVHPRAFLDGKEKPLFGDILHYGYRDFFHFIEKLNNQTTLEAKKWISDKRRINAARISYKAVDRFLRNYLGKRGFQDGFLGLILSLFHSFYQLFTYSKYLELKHEEG